MAAMLGVASGRVVRSFEIQVAKATNGQKNGSAEESTLWTHCGEISGKLIFQGGCCSNFSNKGHEKSGV